MSSFFRSFCISLFVFMLVMVGRNAFASDSGQLKVELQDAAAIGMGGAFTGEADRPSAVYYNPAGIVQMDSPEVSGDLTWIQPQMKFNPASGGDSSKSKEDNNFFPNFFATAPIIKNKLYVGLGESTDFGGGNDYEANGFSRYSTIKDGIADQDYRVVLAYKITDKWSVGAGPVDDQSHFEHDVAIPGVGPLGSDGNALFKANDNAWGFDLATMFKLNDQNQFGLTYKSPIHHDYNGTLYLSNLNPAGFGALFGNVSSASTKATQKLTLPQSVTLGYDFKPTNKWTFNFDLEWTDWSQYKQQITVYPNATTLQAQNLGSGVPQARDWSSVWSEAIGAQYAVTDKFRVRTGFQHHQSPIPQANFDTDYPDLTSNAVSCGFGYDITSKLTIDVAYAAVFEDTRNVTTTIGNTALNGKYNGFVNIGMMTLTYKF